MSNRKNLTGEKKGTFTTLDITQSLNIDDNGCFVSSGNILSSGLITAVHGNYDNLFAKSFSCTNASFYYVEFDEQWTDISTANNLSFINGCFTTLNNVTKQTFSYISNLNSDAQSQIDNVSSLAHGTSDSLNQLSNTVTDVSNVASYASNTVNNLSNVVYSVSLVAHAAYDNGLGLAEKLNNVSSNYWVTRQTLNDYITSNNITTSSLSSSMQTNKNSIDIVNACLIRTNMSTNYWKTNSSLQTITSSLTSTITWLGNVSLYDKNVSTTVYNLSNTVNALLSCLASVSSNFWTTKQNFNTVSSSLISTTN